jgi:hypothetical protein
LSNISIAHIFFQKWPTDGRQAADFLFKFELLTKAQQQKVQNMQNSKLAALAGKKSQHQVAKIEEEPLSSTNDNQYLEKRSWKAFFQLQRANISPNSNFKKFLQHKEDQNCNVDEILQTLMKKGLVDEEIIDWHKVTRLCFL